MAINTLQMAQNFQTLLDQQMVVGATSGFMEVNAGEVKYNGGDTVKIPTLSVDGLANYDRDNGYNRGGVSLKYQDFKLTQDRGRKFLLDSMDVDESNFLATGTNVMTAFQKEQVIPEIDAYRYSKVAAYATQESRKTDAFTPDDTNIIKQLNKEIMEIEDLIGETGDLVIVMSARVQGILNEAAGAKGLLDVANFTHGAYNTRVRTYNEIPGTNVMTAFQKEQVIPEIDAYRYSKVAAYATQESRKTDAFTPDDTNIIKQLNKEIMEIEDLIGETGDLVIVMSARVQGILNEAAGAKGLLDVANFTHGAYNTRVRTYNEIPIIGVPSARMKSQYVFNDGTTSGQEKGGFKADTGAKAINWLIMSRAAAIAVSKTDQMRIFDPNTTQQANAWSIDYRKFHDVWVPKNRLASVWANFGA